MGRRTNLSHSSKIETRRTQLNQGQITSTARSTALGNNAVDGQDYQGEFPSEDEEEEGVDVYSDVTVLWN